MPSILPGYEYDIFISYRQKDNKYDGWVTDFVNNLKRELEATFKEEVSVYFDENPHDGLLEMHNVEKSLGNKLKSIIFIPIISQTYCDIKSYAWIHEFCAFNKLSKEDKFGRDIKLSSGNVSARILAVKIHDLDLEDKRILENELGETLRAIEFIYRESGVNRPLKPGDNKNDNQNKTDYRNQINKVANAAKEIIASLKSRETGNEKMISEISAPKNKSHITSKKSLLTIAFWTSLIVVLAVSGIFLVPLLSRNSTEDFERSIAVLPFDVISQDKNLEYLGDGFAESISAALDDIKGLKVIGRRSSFQFKGEKTDPRVIGQKLQVSTLLEGSVQVSVNDLRIAVKLINAKDGSDIWTEKFKGNLTMDYFAIQDEITERLVKRFKFSSARNPDSVTSEPPTKNMEAYEMVIKGNYFIRQGPAGGGKALEYYQNAIKLDSGYADAYLGLSMGYFFTGAKNEMKEALDMAHQLNANESQYHKNLAGYYFIYEWNWEGVRTEHEKLRRISSSGSIAYAWYLALSGKYNEAIQEMELFLSNDPLHSDGLRNLSNLCIITKQFDRARRNLMKITDIDPNYTAAYERMGYSYSIEGDYDEAIKYYNKAYDLSGSLSPKIGIVIALAQSGKKDEAKQLFNQILTEIKLSNRKSYAVGISIGGGYAGTMALVYFSFGEPDEAFKWLNLSYEGREAILIGLKIDPIYDPYRKDPRFIKIYRKMNFPE